MKQLLEWLGLALGGIFIAALFAAVPFWAHGLSVEQAAWVSAVVFPVVLGFYAYAIWRESRDRRR